MAADRRLVAVTQRRHGHHDAQYRRNDTETGQRIGDTGHGVGRMLELFLHAQQFHVEQAFEFVRRHVARRHDAQVIADERDHLLVLEDGGVLGEDRAGGDVFDVGLDGHHALATTLVENLEQQAQHFQIVGMAEARLEHLQRLLQHDHGRAAGVGLQKRAQGRTADDHHLEGLDQGGQLTM
ncbi:hypothetical protein ABMD26_001865 [Pseudomonas sp. PvP001]